jgi:hypothetical protein
VNQGTDNTMVLKKKYKTEVIRSRKSSGRQYNGIKEKGPKRLWEAVNRWKDNTMVLKKKYQRGNQKPSIGGQKIQWY